ncbi:MAG: GDYXXLXY domain-containing protein [Anaerolineae bacterium]
MRLHDSQTPLAENELLLRYRRRAFDVRIGPESFFFQEGHAKYYDDAGYAELRVSMSGDVLLVGLRGDGLEVLGPP